MPLENVSPAVDQPEARAAVSAALQAIKCAFLYFLGSHTCDPNLFLPAFLQAVSAALEAINMLTPAMPKEPVLHVLLSLNKVCSRTSMPAEPHSCYA
eukprot:1158431-Pelagomonas_calceolata.AAC.10